MSTTSATPSASPSPPRKTAWLAFLLVLLAAMATHLGKATRTETPIYRPPFNPTLIRSHRLTPTADPTGSPLLLDIAYTRTSFRRFPPSFHGAGAGGRGYSPALVSPPPPPLRPRTDSSCIDPDPSSHRQGGGGCTRCLCRLLDSQSAPVVHFTWPMTVIVITADPLLPKLESYQPLL